MPTPRAWRGASRRLIVSFVLVLLVPATAVVWLGARLVEQDRALASRQLRERRESAADRVIAGLEQALSSTERQRVGGAADTLIRPDDDAVRVTLTATAIDVVPANRLLSFPRCRRRRQNRSRPSSPARRSSSAPRIIGPRRSRFARWPVRRPPQFAPAPCCVSPGSNES
jgi:hypothetical protein